MHEIIYVSAAVAPFAEAELAELLARAREKNRRLGVTGMLVYDRGAFIQLLEGEHSFVQPLFEHISADPRHHRLTLLSQSTRAERSFADWPMGFVSLRRNGVAGFVDFWRPDPASSGEAVPVSAAVARQILLAFRDPPWRRHVDV